jgi:flagellar motor switch protein FliG
MFVFEDLRTSKNRHPRDRHRADKKQLTVALKGASDVIRQRVVRQTCRSAPSI